MRKDEIRSVIRNRLPQLDKTAKFHPRFLDAVIEDVYHEMLEEVFRMSPHSLQRYTKEYGFDTALAVEWEATTESWYTTLPEYVYTLPDKASGVRRVATKTQTSIKFYPIDYREADLLAYGSYANTVKDQIGYLVTPLRVQYYGNIGDVADDGVRMNLLIPFSEYADSDIVPYPPHVLEDGRGFFDRIVDKLIAKPAVDLIDNNKDKE